MLEDAIVFEVEKDNIKVQKQVDELLHKEGIKRDKFLDYTSALMTDDGRVVATGSLYKNTMRCLAVDTEFQGYGLIAKIVTALREKELERGYSHYFGYTKIESAVSFLPLGFYEIARIDNKLVFMENKKNGFKNYLQSLEKYKRDGCTSAIVMNANPFTYGHLNLIKTALKESDTLHVFVLSEDESIFPSDVRLSLVEKGVSDLNGVYVHSTGPYLISNATFPTYFLKNDSEAFMIHSRLDIEMFEQIAKTLNIKKRFVGEEPFSKTTDIYNKTMHDELPKKGIELKVIPRLEIDGTAVSASTVRTLIKNGDFESVQALVPKTTYDYLLSKDASEIIEKITNKE